MTLPSSIRTFLTALFLWTSSIAAEPVPSFYQEPGLSPQRDYVDQHYAESIDPFTGKLQLRYTDPTLLRPDRTVGQSFLGAERNVLDNKGLSLSPNGVYVPKQSP